ncbi:MAG TPA: M1 family aminopeptidase [Vicinamibacterales bacterium]|nr:M1 family aminopeptidase [Vicinamibacterales bacterium]
MAFVAHALAAVWLLGFVMQVRLDPDLGISEALARDRSARLTSIRYDLAFTIPAARSQPVAGRALIRFVLKGTSDPLVLDYQPDRAGFLRSVEANGKETSVRQVNGHIIVPPDVLREGENSLALEFNAGDGPLNRNDEFLYTVFVPARAHQAFPCFDQPDLKARWSLALDVPEGWQALGNGAELERQNAGGRTRVRFAGTPPVSTYLFAFAAGKFAVEQAERNGRTFRMFHRETDAAKVARNRDAIFDLHAGALAWLEDFTAIPYPFGKFDFLLAPAFQFGGMEHPGSIFYNANGLLLDESATQDQTLNRASIIAHETAHMWFGDLVTMRWFSDVWMKEVFANHLAAKIVNPAFPAINHDLRYLIDHFPAAYAVDRTAGTNEIRQPLANLNEAGTLYGAIIYQKAPIVMRQLETLIGSEGFRDGLREYLKMYAFGNASWHDLIALLDDRTPEDLAGWSHAWVEERGRPIVTTEVSLENGRIRRLAFKQHDGDARRNLIWNQRMQVAVGAKDTTLLPVQLNAPRVEVPAARGLPARFVLPNGGGIAYGEFHLDRASLAWLMANLPAIEDELTRGSAWVTLWDSMLAGQVKPAAFLDLAIAALGVETNELNITRVLAYVREAYWRHTEPPARRPLARRLEPVLRAGLAAAPTTTLKSVWFSALRDVADTPATVMWLTRVWKQEEKVPGLTLAELDYIRLAQDLAVRNAAGAKSILDEQYAKIKNPDRKAQFEFVRPAISPSGKERDAWFAALADVSNRRREPWVLEGLRYLHHPLRADASEKYLEPSLLLVREIQRTGDIFFPKRWMDATLSGYQSASAAATIREFLDRLPADYPERLRRIILSSADDLFRATRIRGR